MCMALPHQDIIHMCSILPDHIYTTPNNHARQLGTSMISWCFHIKFVPRNIIILQQNNYVPPQNIDPCTV